MLLYQRDFGCGEVEVVDDLVEGLLPGSSLQALVFVL